MPALIAAAGESAKLRFLEFFTANSWSGDFYIPWDWRAQRRSR
jgi:hypothetical protein